MPPSPPLSFDRVVYGGEPQGLFHCAFCGRSVESLKYEVYERAACEVCAERVLAQLPANDRRTFARSVGVGLLAAVAASLVYFVLLRALPQSGFFTASVFAALPVGWCIGKLMRRAAHGAGGRRYQVAAVALSYAAVIYPLQFFTMGVRETAWWMYPLVLLRPVAFLCTDLRTIGALELWAAFLAMRWAWKMLRGQKNPVSILCA